MKKKMFSRFTSILQHAVDAVSLAPQLSLQEEFVFHWKAVTSFFIDNKGEKQPIDQTSIPSHLEQMLVILQQEDMQCERGMYGPCLEYLLQHKLLETLYSLGRSDYPPGMKQIVLSFFTKLLSRIKQPLLAHVSVYRAVQRLIKTCGEVKAGPTEIEEIQFLCTVCAKIKADPYIVNFFLEMPKPPQNTSASGTSTPIVHEPASENKLKQQFHLVTTLLNLSHSEDSRVAVKACEGLILCSSLPDPIAAHCMVNSTNFCQDFTQRLIETYKKLPSDVNPMDLENVQAKWGMEVVTKREDDTTFAGKRHLVSFLSWLDYCDQLSAIANPIVAEALARTIHQTFLTPYVLPDMLQICESGCITTTAYMTRCLRTVCSERMLSELVLFLLGDDRHPEVHGETKESLRSRLIDRCNGVSEEVCLVTLQLFDTLLQKDDEHILQNLVLRNIEQRDYFDSKATRKTSIVDKHVEKADACIPSDNHAADKNCGLENDSTVKESHNEAESQSESEAKPQSESEAKPETESEAESPNLKVEKVDDKVTKTEELEINGSSENSAESECDTKKKMCQNEKEQSGNTLKVDGKINDDKFEEVSLSPFSTPLHVKTEVHKIVNSFLTLLPEELKSSYQTADGGYDMYLKDAHKLYAAVVESCKSWGYPLEFPKLKTSSPDQFYEGSFLHMILDKLSHLLDQSYPINLQVTSVISKLALVPHPCLHEFLLDPYLPLKPGVRNLFSIFQKVSNEIKSQYASESDLSQKLIKVRRKLMGSSSSMQRFLGLLPFLSTRLRLDDESRLEAIIVFEEFCKELSAIVFVKHHAAVTEDRQ
ncbi:FHF complex subunit HOOK interacting protein 2A-like isoform X3 [Ruditapes philippinarum]|uniref:FHF complex subunit HOOK interacting protein 2A-like isoform X3 n=1 Tax=Ruditapes philippinarum TaxID=129788 RepID=UPI00295AA27D|nr:FHF complex subunit HOOK interacting protein 2A-like isoform X3 [Ruditapes philippinarum]